MRVLISYVVAIVVFTFLSVSTAKLHLMVEQEQLTGNSMTKTNIDLQNTTQKDQATITSPQTEGDL
jgi:hypothetical protein